MNAHVARQLIRSSEGLLAAFFRTLVRSCSSMSTNMFGEVRRLREGLVAIGTLERALPAVCTFVDGQCACYGECPATAGMVADVGFLLCVPSHVLLEGSGLGEILKTHFALERSVTGVRLKVSRNLLLARKAFVSISCTLFPETIVMGLATPNMHGRNVCGKVVGGCKRLRT